MLWNLLLPLAQANETQSLGASVGGIWKLIITVACVALAYLAGRLISRSVRMPDYGWKIAVMTFTLLVGVAVVALGWPPKFGIDLYGGVNLVYEVDVTKVGPDQSVDMDQLIAAVRLRVDPTGTKQIVIRPYGQGNALEIIVPRVSQAEVEELKRQIVDLGTLEFRITANTKDDADTIAAARALNNNQKSLNVGGIEIARWVPVNEKRSAAMDDPATYVTRYVRDSTDENAPEIVELLVIIDPENVNGEYLRQVSPGRSTNGRPSVNFRFNSEGATKFLQLTTEHQPDPSDGFKRHLAIALSGELYSAPELNEPISQSGEIAGNFTPEEQASLVAVLNAGSLPAALNKSPLREQQISPTLGLDTINRGKIAMAVSMGIVLLFVLVYYRFAGVVACLALVTNLVLILAIMISINAAFTLPGLAGLVLTVGMAVDANVLIYERIREELARGAALRMAIRNGFSRATTTIVDANLTTLITAVVLYAIGTDQIKGFAVTLILGILLSMYTAVFCSRVVFEIGERARMIKQLNMMRMFTSTNFNFLGKKMICGVISLVLIVVGLGAVVMRGSGILDIDFTGGSQAQILFAEDTHDGQRYDTGFVRTQIDNWNKSVTDAVSASNLESHLGPQLVQSLNVALRESLIRETKSKYTAEKRAELKDSEDDTQDVEAIIDAEVTQEVDKILPGEFEQRLPELASLSDLSVSEVTYLDDVDHKPEFVVNTSNKVLIAVETILNRVFEGQLQTNKMEFTRAAAVAPPADADPFGSFPGPTNSGDGADNAAAGNGDAAGSGDGANNAGDGKTDDNTTGDGNSTDGNDGGLSRLLAPWPAMNMALLSWQDPPTDPPANNQTGDNQQPRTDPAATTPAPQESARANLTFDHNIGHDDVVNLIHEVTGPNVNITVSNPEYVLYSTQTFKDWTVEFAGLPWSEAEAWLNQVKANIAQRPVFPATNNIGSQVAGDTRNIGIAAMIASLFFIVVYIWIRFQKVAYGFAAVVALIHDVLITLGAIAISAYLTGIPTIDAFKINLEMLAAFLTLIGYSLNDTIVIFDRIREVKGKSPRLTEEMINTSVNQTLSRTILTSGTTLIVVAILYFFGGQGVHGFSFALFVGVIVGTYSSIFVASPVLLWMSKFSETSSGSGAKTTGKLQRPETSA